jgi:hypothetical protein
MAGDLIEQYHDGRSTMWYRWQVLTTILAAAVAEVREHKLLAVRAIAIWYVAMNLLYWLTVSLRQSLFPGFLNSEWRSEILRQFWAWYGVPFVLLQCVGYAAIGWAIARVQRPYAIAMVVLCAAIQLVPATLWGWRTWTLLQAGLWGGWSAFWDFRNPLLFHAVCWFTVYPLCILLGGFWGVRSPANRASPTPSS